MVECNICGKQFNSNHQLRGHKSIHREGGRYSPGSRKNNCIQSANCLYCGKNFQYDINKTLGKFCSNVCFGANKKKENQKLIAEGLGKDPKTIKKYITENISNSCYECGQLPEWNGKILTLQLDHIDGNSDNNSIKNLRLLCPNCHSQTETFTGRNVKNTKRNSYLRKYKSKI